MGNARAADGRTYEGEALPFAQIKRFSETHTAEKFVIRVADGEHPVGYAGASTTCG